MSDLGGQQFVYMKRCAPRICTICDYQGNFDSFGGYFIRPNGVALLMVPICEGLDQTFENNKVSTDQGRWEHCQQPDHVTVLGRDFRQMIRDAGFQIAEFVAERVNAVRYGLVMDERVFVARKRTS